MATYNDIQSLFFESCQNGNLELLQNLVQRHGVPLHQTDQNLRTAAHIAAAHNQLSVLQWLCEQRVNLNLRDSSGHTPAQLAEKNNCDRTLRYLIQQGFGQETLAAAHRDVVTLEKSQPDHVVQETYDFVKSERITYFKQQDGSLTFHRRENFGKIENSRSLKRAFALYKARPPVQQAEKENLFPPPKL